MTTDQFQKHFCILVLFMIRTQSERAAIAILFVNIHQSSSVNLSSYLYDLIIVFKWSVGHLSYLWSEEIA